VNNAIRAQNAQVAAGTMGDLPNITGQSIAATGGGSTANCPNVEQFGNIVAARQHRRSAVR
jgi:multidrug efflux pump